MPHYYNFTASANHISYDPYWYVKLNLPLNSFLVICFLTLGLIYFYAYDSKNGIMIAILVSIIFLLNCIYRLKIKHRTTFLFDKIDNKFYKITPFGKKEIAALNTILNITTKSGAHTYCYILTSKTGSSIKRYYLTNNIRNENQNNPEVRFLEMEIIPQLELFLNLDKELLIALDSKDISSI
ncbi:hypothetical protein [Flavobacterium phragmitis]|uniref:Uncharacterized protein n=1 Tax=Flavobacterium phragmitis TaxID=739143 RepID=A0A1I1PN40_9FLAO|nr:hypothetical protein [Flavobacterium phragmitis]SFD11142.1 hypothetical protein SAMN05216297_104264 [Flavobacterium phragmitis]